MVMKKGGSAKECPRLDDNEGDLPTTNSDLGMRGTTSIISKSWILDNVEKKTQVVPLPVSFS